MPTSPDRDLDPLLWALAMAARAPPPCAPAFGADLGDEAYWTSMYSLQVRHGRLQPCRRRWEAAHSHGICWHEHLPIPISRPQARQARTRWPLSRHASIRPASCSSPTAQRDPRPGRRRLSSGYPLRQRERLARPLPVGRLVFHFGFPALFFPINIPVLFGHLSCSLLISH
jgi:hypothetical protein